MDKKFDIRKTFETFWTQPLSILKEGLFQLVNIQTNIFTRPSVDIDYTNDKTQITVVNSEKLYNRIKAVLFRPNAGEKE